MLTSFRQFAQSPVALVIIVLLVLGFALYGVGGIFTGSGTAVVVVGQEQISQRELARAYQRELDRIQQQNPDFTREQAQAAGLGDQVLQQLIVQSAFYDKARQLGLVTSDRALTTEIRSYEAFRNPVTGSFDRESYLSALQNGRYSIPDFENTVSEDLTRGQLADSLTAGDAIPTGLAATRYLVQQEQRAMRALIIDAASADAVADPTDEQLQSFIDANPTQVDQIGLPVFTAPEYRSLTLVRFQLTDFIADVELDEALLRETYEYNLETGAIGTPASRSFFEIVAGDEATANAIVERLNAGEDAEAIARDLGLEAPLTQTDVQAYQVPDSGLADAIFAMDEGSAAAVQGNFGWFAVRVTAATPAVIPTYEDQLPDLRTEAAREVAIGHMYDKMGEFEQYRADGQSLEDAARHASLPVESFVPMDQYARDQEGNLDFERYQSLAAEILPTAFDQFAGFAIDLQQYNDTDWYTLRVDDIIPEHPRALDEVRDEAEAYWRAAQIDSQLQTRADEALAQLQAGDDMEFVVLTTGGRIETTTLKRDETADSFTANIVAQGFSQNVGEPQIVQQRGRGPHMILVVDEILPAQLEQAPIGSIEALQTAIQGEIVQDILMSAQSALLNEYNIDGSSIDQRLRAGALGETDTP
tara:strand:+ start:8050 stop:9984 length:1935 start_codon:yes stop_codon:yes gene_type:complete